MGTFLIAAIAEKKDFAMDQVVIVDIAFYPIGKNSDEHR